MLTPEIVARIELLLLDGCDATEIAKSTGIDRQLIADHLRPDHDDTDLIEQPCAACVATYLANRRTLDVRYCWHRGVTWIGEQRPFTVSRMSRNAYRRALVKAAKEK
jgi:hypothetical protein